MPEQSVFLLLIPFVIILLVIIIKGVYNLTDHIKIEDKTALRINAKIKNVERKIVGSKGSKKYRTTIEFDDGFTYISHKTQDDNFIIMHRISISSELNDEIMNDAIEAHKKAVLQRDGKL